jgi:hypothetical protein
MRIDIDPAAVEFARIYSKKHGLTNRLGPQRIAI